MTINNRDSLRTQLINSMAENGLMTQHRAAQVYEDALWPVLDAAMKAGELLVARNTQPQQPVPDAIVSWLKSTLATIKIMQAQEATVSKAEAMRCLEQLRMNAEFALRDAERANNPLVTVPLKGTIS